MKPTSFQEKVTQQTELNRLLNTSSATPVETQLKLEVLRQQERIERLVRKNNERRKALKGLNRAMQVEAGIRDKRIKHVEILTRAHQALTLNHLNVCQELHDLKARTKGRK